MSDRNEFLGLILISDRIDQKVYKYKKQIFVINSNGNKYSWLYNREFGYNCKSLGHAILKATKTIDKCQKNKPKLKHKKGYKELANRSYGFSLGETPRPPFFGFFKGDEVRFINS